MKDYCEPQDGLQLGSGNYKYSTCAEVDLYYIGCVSFGDINLANSTDISSSSCVTQITNI